MNKLVSYINTILGLEVLIRPISKHQEGRLPLFLKEGYKWNTLNLDKQECILAQEEPGNIFSISRIEKNMEKAKSIFGISIVIVFNELESYQRKRLIEKRIAFIVPNKQLYIPEFMMDLREYGFKKGYQQSKLVPLAQQIVLLYILDKGFLDILGTCTFKELAKHLATKPMEVTRAANNLKKLGVADIKGTKEKIIQFRFHKKELWQYLLKKGLLIIPVQKRVYLDALPVGIDFPLCNISALSEYSNINPDYQKHIAIGKKQFTILKKKQELEITVDPNGNYCLEIWKYNPNIKSSQFRYYGYLVDPLSLYLSLQESTDERIQIALEKLINGII